jgi:RNA-binding protein
MLSGSGLSGSDKRRLRAAAHGLSPIVIVAARGVTDSVVAETDRALRDHELIKVRVEIDDRDARRSAGSTLAERCAAEVAQTIGKIWVLYRANPGADPKLSNLRRRGA